MTGPVPTRTTRPCRLSLSTLCLAAAALFAAPAAAQEIRPGSMNPDIVETAAALPLGYSAKWENYSPDGRFFAETSMTLAERTGAELTWDVRHLVVADDAIAGIIRQAAADGLIAIARDDEDGIEIVSQTITDKRMRVIVKGTPFGYEYNDPHDCTNTFSLCRFTRTLPSGEVYHLVRWGELYGGVWSYRVNYDPWKDPAERRDELFRAQASLAEDGLTLDEMEIWDEEVIAVLRRIED
ncbi:hypothetical protein ACQ5SO_05395 [Rhodovulum sp. DZ06]|uniref:hypothetical protein n=1 Tax=Rhodovulum sp. DZ06 TaxID=3425126 RepID=UPI003D34E48E